jgi:type 1 fimbriae regulatory protein FimB/type 1 fimbriae regulatory protein FimE
MMPTSKDGGNGTVPPKTLPCVQKRPGKYLTIAEVEELISVAMERGRDGQRDATMILLAYWHGLRVSELCSLQWEQVDFAMGLLQVRQVKHDISIVHPLRPPELRALRQLQRESTPSSYLFMAEHGSPMTAAEFRTILTRVAQLSSLPFPIYPHILRHACADRLVNEGHDTRSIQHYLGYKNIQHTVCCTKLADNCFQEFWQD